MSRSLFALSVLILTRMATGADAIAMASSPATLRALCAPRSDFNREEAFDLEFKRLKADDRSLTRKPADAVHDQIGAQLIDFLSRQFSAARYREVVDYALTCGGRSENIDLNVRRWELIGAAFDKLGQGQQALRVMEVLIETPRVRANPKRLLEIAETAAKARNETLARRALKLMAASKGSIYPSNPFLLRLEALEDTPLGDSEEFQAAHEAMSLLGRDTFMKRLERRCGCVLSDTLGMSWRLTGGIGYEYSLLAHRLNANGKSLVSEVPTFGLSLGTSERSSGAWYVEAEYFWLGKTFVKASNRSLGQSVFGSISAGPVVAHGKFAGRQLTVALGSPPLPIFVFYRVEDRFGPDGARTNVGGFMFKLPFLSLSRI